MASPIHSVLTRLRDVPASVLREWLLLTVTLCIAGGLLARYEVLSPLDALWYDAIIAGQTLTVADDITLITIEPDTLDPSDLSRRTWNEGDSAALLNRLAPNAPAAVLLDIPMVASDPRDLAGGQALSAAIRASGKVVLPISLQMDRGQIQGFRLPVARLANFTSELGHDRLMSRSAGVVRRMPLVITNGDISWDHVVLAVLRTAKQMPPKLPKAPIDKTINGWQETQYLYLRFTDPQRAFTTYTARQVLNGEVPARDIRGKLVLIGGKLADAAVPVPGEWRAGRTMWGVEVFANAINTLRQQAWPSAVSPRLAAALTVTLSLLTLLFFLALPDRSGLAITIYAFTIVALLDWALLSFAGLWFPYASFAVTTALAYPLWAWRRLSATYRFVTVELERMRAEPGVMGARGDLSRHETGSAWPMLIDQHLGAIQEATAKLRVARKFVADIVEGLPIAVIVVDTKGVVVLANKPAAEIGLAIHHGQADTGEELIGRELGAVFDDFTAVGGEDMRRDWSVDRSFELLAASGKRYWLACRQMTNDAGARFGAVIALTDISALRETEEQREELLRFLSHDMRSPLASILALIELRRESAELSNDNERFDEIKRYARHTLSLAEEFLQLAYATGSKPLEFELIDLTHAVELGIDLVRPLAHERHVAIKLVLPEAAVVRGNHNLIGRMVANLVHNAVKFSPERGTIDVSLTREADEWVCLIADKGEGIAPDDMPNMFQPYRRVLGDKRKGAGLGLSFVLVVVEKHGGRIDICGEPGRGTTVTVRLPALECDGSRAGDHLPDAETGEPHEDTDRRG